MKLPLLNTLFVALLTMLSLGACSSSKWVDPTVGLPTGAPQVVGQADDPSETQIMTDKVMALTAQYPHRPAFETAVMQQIRLGNLKASKLMVVYADGAAKVFK